MCQFKKNIPGNCDDNKLNFIMTYCDVNCGMLNIKCARLLPYLSDGLKENPTGKNNGGSQL